MEIWKQVEMMPGCKCEYINSQPTSEGDFMKVKSI